MILNARRKATEQILARAICRGGNAGIVSSANDAVDAATNEGDRLTSDAEFASILEAVAVAVVPEEVAETGWHSGAKTDAIEGQIGGRCITEVSNR